MSKYQAWEQWYPRDWLNDNELSKCKPATRGIWTDALARMMLSQCGELSGTPDQLAQLCRCSAEEARDAANDLFSNGAADVTERNGIITLSNRRRAREHKLRTDNAKRQAKHRENADALGVSRKSHDPPLQSPLSPQKSENAMKTNSREGSARQPAGMPSLETVLEWARMDGVDLALAELFWNWYESSGWSDSGGNPIHKPRNRLAVWKAKAQAKGFLDKAGKPVAGGSLWELKTRMDLIREQLRQVANRGSTDAFNVIRFSNKEDEALYRKLKAELADIKRKLGLT